MVFHYISIISKYTTIKIPCGNTIDRHLWDCSVTPFYRFVPSHILVTDSPYENVLHWSNFTIGNSWQINPYQTGLAASHLMIKNNILFCSHTTQPTLHTQNSQLMKCKGPQSRFPGSKVKMAGSEPLIQEAYPHITKLTIGARM